MDSIKYWSAENFEISSHMFNLHKRVNKMNRVSGSDKTGANVYTYNELGFRGDSISKEGFKVMSIGCSFTEGVGVNDKETWPHLFSRLISNGVNFNFGTSGRSNDYVSRCLISYFDTIKPDLVLIMYPHMSRREFYTENGGIEPYMPAVAWSYMLETDDGKNVQKNLFEIQNDNEDYINWYKNHLLIKYFLEHKKCNWLWNGSFLYHDYTEFNRFDGDYSLFTDRGTDGGHPGPKTNLVYAQKLHEHIKINFPDYLPNDEINVEKLKFL